MSPKENAEKMAGLQAAMTLSESMERIARRKLLQAEKLLKIRSKRLMSAGIDLTGARWEYARFCQGIDRGPCGPKGRIT